MTRNRSRFPLTLSAIATCAALAFIGSAAAQGAAAGDPVSGKRLYHEHGCYGCHGFNGETGARRLAGVNDPILQNPDTFLIFLRARADVMPLLPSTSMPSYPVSALSDGEARDIYAYVRTFVLDAPDPKSIPTLQTIIDSVKPARNPAH